MVGSLKCARGRLVSGVGAAALLVGLAATVPANAADLPYRMPVKAAPIQLYDWTGFYLGVNVGGGVGRNSTRQLVAAGDHRENFFLSPAGVIGGVQAGYNWQLGRDFLVGLEADFQGAGQRDSQTCILDCGRSAFMSYDQRIDWFGTARVRAGLVTGPVVSYVTGGLAYGNVKTSITDTANAPFATSTLNTDTTKTGFVIGSGVEASLGGNWTGKIEYLYIDLGKSEFAFAPGFLGTHQVSTHIRDHIFRGGVNYRFGGNGTYAPPVANWAGLYIGASAGSVLGRDKSTLSTSAGTLETINLSPEGYAGGAQLGYNWQFGPWVIGAEADFQGGFARDRDACVTFCRGALVTALEQTLPYLGTARVRAGYSVGSTLFYATGGLAYGKTRTVLNQVNGFAAGQTELSHWKAGYAVGGGIESPFDFLGLFGPNWTAKSEYLYVDLGRTTDTFAASGMMQTFTTSTREHVFRSGINYHFNAPVVAKY
jgi:outer membrane immunogenic protein